MTILDVGKPGSGLTAPALDTPRLRLRGHRLDDFADTAALWGDPVVTRFIGGLPLTPEESWTRLLRYVGHWTLLGFGYWTVHEIATGRFVGEVGFADYRRDIDPPLAGVPEIGWVLAPWAHGAGFATEAVRAILGWGEIHFNSRATTCVIAPENVRSIRLAERCGYREIRRAIYHGEPIVVFERSWR
jgi:RimJ/RimL family protein N-acetyltransferase